MEKREGSAIAIVRFFFTVNILVSLVSGDSGEWAHYEAGKNAGLVTGTNTQTLTKQFYLRK